MTYLGWLCKSGLVATDCWEHHARISGNWLPGVACVWCASKVCPLRKPIITFRKISTLSQYLFFSGNPWYVLQIASKGLRRHLWETKLGLGACKIWTSSRRNLYVRKRRKKFCKWQGRCHEWAKQNASGHSQHSHPSACAADPSRARASLPHAVLHPHPHSHPRPLLPWLPSVHVSHYWRSLRLMLAMCQCQSVLRWSHPMSVEHSINYYLPPSDWPSVRWSTVRGPAAWVCLPKLEVPSIHKVYVRVV